MTDVDPDKPASEQFDLETAAEAPDVDAETIESLARDLERVVEQDTDLSDEDDETLADLVAACKRLENATEDARKECYEDELGERVTVGQSVGPVAKQSGSNTWVADTEGAFAAVAGRGADPLDVAKVSVGDLRDVLGAEADEYLGTSEYEYFRRQA